MTKESKAVDNVSEFNKTVINKVMQLNNTKHHTF
jgi:hypothetical protein